MCVIHVGWYGVCECAYFARFDRLLPVLIIISFYSSSCWPTIIISVYYYSNNVQHVFIIKHQHHHHHRFLLSFNQIPDWLFILLVLLPLLSIDLHIFYIFEPIVMLIIIAKSIWKIKYIKNIITRKSMQWKWYTNNWQHFFSLELIKRSTTQHCHKTMHP